MKKIEMPKKSSILLLFLDLIDVGLREIKKAGNLSATEYHAAKLIHLIGIFRRSLNNPKLPPRNAGE
ncbi:MAG: hypothetical protein Q8P84_09575 [Deltaproteobacteria bacterium]|nr:hypothetical protein [Deltaproteobacteria bacterium]